MSSFPEKPCSASQPFHLHINSIQLQYTIGSMHKLHRFCTEMSLTLGIPLLVIPGTYAKMQVEDIPVDEPGRSNAYTEPFKCMKPIWRRSRLIANMPDGSTCPLACAGCAQTGLSDLGHLGCNKQRCHVLYSHSWECQLCLQRLGKQINIGLRTAWVCSFIID